LKKLKKLKKIKKIKILPAGAAVVFAAIVGTISAEGPK
jgi:hypothetical protein